jgi:hypothetical protein
MRSGSATAGLKVGKVNFGIKPNRNCEQRKNAAILRKVRPTGIMAQTPQGVSQIGFPYNDLESGIAVARAILNNGSQLSRDQLAGALSQSPASGAFILKVSSAKQFGLVAGW